MCGAPAANSVVQQSHQHALNNQICRVVSHKMMAATYLPVEVSQVAEQNAESEIVTAAMSSVTGIVDDADWVEAVEQQYSNNALMDGLAFLNGNHDVIKRLIEDTQPKLKKLAVDNQDYKTMSRTTSNNMAILRRNLKDFTTTHRSEMEQMDITFAKLHETMEMMMAMMHHISGLSSVDLGT